MVSITLVLKLGSLSNEKGKKATGSDWQNSNSVRGITPFVHFFAVTARLRRGTSNFTFYGGREHKTTMFFFFLWT